MSEPTKPTAEPCPHGYEVLEDCVECMNEIGEQPEQPEWHYDGDY